MAGYSGTPLPKKLGIKPGGRVGLAKAPPDFATTLGALPEGAIVHDAAARAPKTFDVLVSFVLTQADLARTLAALPKRLDPAGGLWIAWPKKASGIATELTDNVVRTAGLGTGLVDNKVCAIDDTWSGLRFVMRLKDRPKSPR